MPAMNTSSINYHAWLLRWWRETPYTPWRLALENISTGERQGFADLEALVAYLQAIYVGKGFENSVADKEIMDENPLHPSPPL
jgi:hypothetical protein